MQVELSIQSGAEINGEVHLVSSKSESNRLLILRAVSGLTFDIHNLSEAEDTRTLHRILNEFSAGNNEYVFDVGAAGSTFRFLTAFFASRNCRVTLTGDQRMKQRPVGELVQALRSLGANIDYLGEEGYPPLQIHGRQLLGGEVSIRADISSQFISALMMVAPGFQNGLTLRFQTDTVSFSYIRLTALLMQSCGMKLMFDNRSVRVQSGIHFAEENEKVFYVSGDWSSASYFYAFAALSESAEIKIYGLRKDSGQADEICAEIFQKLGVDSFFIDEYLLIKKSRPVELNYFEFDFKDCPDIAQTVAVVCAAKKIKTRLTGLQTLRKKETDRIAALQNELSKFFVDTSVDDNALNIDASDADFINYGIPISTYSDHRMAMSFAPLVLLTKTLTIESPDVVKKSFPLYWNCLEKIGIQTKIS